MIEQVTKKRIDIKLIKKKWNHENTSKKKEKKINQMNTCIGF